MPLEAARARPFLRIWCRDSGGVYASSASGSSLPVLAYLAPGFRLGVRKFQKVLAHLGDLLGHQGESCRTAIVGDGG